MGTFGWLHFTDLHRGMKDQRGWWSDWESKLFDDLRNRHDRDHPWDVVLFTGDLTDRGTEEHFRLLDGFLDKLWGLFEELQPGHPVALLAVPGNHDLQRPDPDKNADDLELIAEWPEPHRKKFRERFWSEPEGRPRKMVTRAFAEYQAWWERRQKATSAVVKIHAGLLPGDFAATIEKGGARIGILGLNSTFLQLAGGDYKERLAIDYQQFDGACGKSGPEWAREHHLCMLITHHPGDWLCAEAKGKLNRIVHGQFALHLYGHMHETAYRAFSVGGRSTERSWQGRSLFGEATYEGGGARPFGYAIGEIALKAREGKLRLWPRSAQSPEEAEGRWKFVPDHKACELDENDKNATFPETLTLHREFVARAVASAAPAVAASPPSSVPALAASSTAATPTRDPRRFRVLLLSTDTDLASTREAVRGYLERALGVEVTAGSVDPATVEPASFEQILLFQGQRWEEGKVASVWERAPADRRTAFLSDPEGDWPPPRLTERPASAKIDALRTSLGAAEKFNLPAELPEKVGALVGQVIAARGSGPELGLKPWERAYLGYSVEVWRGGRTAASRLHLVSSSVSEEPYSPELYIALDGHAEGWVCGDDQNPRRLEKGEAEKLRNLGQLNHRVPLARWIPCAEFPRLALVGAPGAGKTVFLTRIAASLGLACLGRPGELEPHLDLDALRAQAGRMPVPVMVEATRLAKQDLNRGLEALLTVIGEELAKGGQPVPGSPALREGLEQGRYFLLVDALDEIADAEQRRRVLDLLRTVGTPECFPRLRLLLTTRSAAYTGDLGFGGFGVVHVASLSQQQIQGFCDRWSRHRRRDEDFTRALQAAVGGLGGHIASEEPTLTSNPLMLTAICLIYEKHRTLPNDRGRLCELLVDDLCQSRRSEDPEHLDWQLNEAAKKRLLQRIALKMQEEGAQNWPEKRALTEIRQTLPVGEVQPDLRASRNLQWIAEHTGLLRFEPGEDGEQVRFWHRLFREYLCASELAQRDRTVSALVEDLWVNGRLNEPFWQDVVRLLPRALGTPEKAQMLAQRLEELAQEHAEARGRLLGLAAAGMIESRELFPGVDFGATAVQIADAYEQDSIGWSLRDRILVLLGLGRLDPQQGDPRLREERWIPFPGGEVELGDEVGDLIQKGVGSPRRKVLVAPFAMAWAPVSVPQYLRFVNSGEFDDKCFWAYTPRKLRGKQSMGSTSFVDEPGNPSGSWKGTMAGVSIYEALAYCAWRNAHRTDGRTVRLPTETEWEYVARAAKGGPYPWGQESPSASAKGKPRELGRGWSGIVESGIYELVGVYPAIAGVVDLVGSFPQWCDSLFNAPYGERLTERAKAYGGVAAPDWEAAVRGRKSSDVSTSLRCAYRQSASCQGLGYHIGFRLVLEPPP